MKKHGKKGKATQILEYSAAYLVFSIVRILPWKVVDTMSSFLGRLLFVFSSKRRNLAIENVRYALKIENDREAKDLALRSCKSFFLTFLEIPKIREAINAPHTMSRLRSMIKDIDAMFQRAREIHEATGGCIFITPHLGSWEMLLYLSAMAHIPMTLIIRPLDNPYIERLLNRETSGQIIMPKTNALSHLKRALREGRSVGMLPDQSTMKGLSLYFFGRQASTTPLPALLAISCKRPIVTVACCRKPDGRHYELFIGEPIWPDSSEDKRAEIIRLTEAMTRSMEDVIRRYPDQYLWMHNRWKRYRHKREFLG